MDGSKHTRFVYKRKSKYVVSVTETNAYGIMKEFIVDFLTLTCVCGLFQKYCLPCIHACAGAAALGITDRELKIEYSGKCCLQQKGFIP